MKEIIQHPVYGEIVYTESFWVGKKSLTVNGHAARPISKKEFLLDEKKVVLKGSALTGTSLIIDGETLVLSPKSKWYEIFLAVFPLIFLLIWGNSSSLCAIFPVVGGAIGGALGGLSLCISLFLMKKATSRMAKVLVGLGVCVLTILISFVLALTIIYLPA